MKEHVEFTSSLHLSRKQLCALFRISKNTLKRREADGMISPVGPNARVLRYSNTDIAALVTAGYDPDLDVAKELGLDLVQFGIPARRSAVSDQSAAGPQSHAISETPFLKSIPNELAPAAFLVKLAVALQKPHIRQAILALVDAAA